MITREYFQRDAKAVARDLLGQKLIRQLPDGKQLSGIIVETEAYLGVKDKAAHTFNGKRTPRNESMYLTGGHAYVYFTYGMHYCFNVTSGTKDEPTAVLIRGLEPLTGIEQMRVNRSRKIDIKRLRDVDLCSGPAKLCQAMNIDKELDGTNLLEGDQLRIMEGQIVSEHDVITTSRVGIGYAEEWVNKPLRFYVKNNPHVSVK